jgi:spore germination protein PB
MRFHIYQNIHIHSIKVNSITNSSVLQIGSAGIIKPYATLANTGGFTGPAPTLQQEGAFVLPFRQDASIQN